VKKLIVVVGLVVSLALACSLQKNGVVREPYRPLTVPKDFDAVMAARPHDGVFRAGVSVVDITPYDRLAWIAGFGQGRKSDGVLDPVTARILFLDDGNEAVVFIVLDVVGMLNSEVKLLRARITDRHPRRIQVIATHNHEAPDTMGYWGPGLLLPVANGIDRDWLDKSMQSIALGVNEALAQAQPVRLALGHAVVEDKWSSNIWFPHPTGPIDRRLEVMRLENMDGRPLATIANWACHAETLLDNPMISADFPGRFYRAVERRGGGTGIFLNGALGGMISPTISRFDERKKYKDLDERVAWMDAFGDRLAELAIAAVEQAPREENPTIALATGEVKVPVRNGMIMMMAKAGIFSREGRKVEGRHFVTEITWLRIGGAQLALVPGEPFPRLGMMLKEAMPYAASPMVVGLANDELGYLPMPDQWEDPMYRYETSVCLGKYTAQIIYDGMLDLLPDLK